MNQEKSQPGIIESKKQPLNIVERLEGPEKDIKREPLCLREIGNDEFQQEFGQEQRKQAQITLQKIIASSKYNTFNLVNPIFTAFIQKPPPIFAFASLRQTSDMPKC